jgi:hypothetical protein
MCLLASKSFFQLVREETVEDGAYPYHNTNKEALICVRVIADRRSIEHGNEHYKCSKKLSICSDFYSSYSSRDDLTAKCRARKGFFENFELRIALGSGLTQPVSDLVQIFQLTDREKKRFSLCTLQ